MRSFLLAAAAFVCIPASSLLAATPLSISVKGQLEGGKVLVQGRTNLTSGTQLVVTLRRHAIGFMAQDKATVHDGAFSAGPFSNGHAALPQGRYEVEISTTVWDLQPAAARPGLGRNYSNFIGPAVKPSTFGTTIAHIARIVVAGTVDTRKDAAERARTAAELLESRRVSCYEAVELAERRSGQLYPPSERNQRIDRCLADVDAETKKRAH